MVVMTWWAASAVVPSQPTSITITEKEAVSIAICPEMGAPSLPVGTAGIEAFSVFAQFPVQEEVCRYCGHGEDSCEQGADTGAEQAEFGESAFAVDQHVVARYVQQVARDDDDHGDGRPHGSVGELLEGVEEEGREYGYRHHYVVGAYQRQEFFGLAHATEIQVENGKYGRHSGGEQRTHLESRLEQAADSPAVALAFGVADKGREPEREAEPGEHEYQGDVVHERGGGQFADPVVAYHEGVGEGDQHGPYLAYHYRTGKFCEPGEYVAVAYGGHSGDKDSKSERKLRRIVLQL